MTGPRYRSLTLAIHPSSRGFGWVAFEGPFSPYAWGSVGSRGAGKNARCLRRIEKIVERLTPETIVLEAFERQNSVRRTRVTDLCRGIVALAAAQSIEVAIYSFGDVRQTFAHVGARTRQEIAEAVARQLPAFQRLVPRKRRAWDSEGHRMHLFSAAALALTNYQRGATVLLDDLSSK